MSRSRYPTGKVTTAAEQLRLATGVHPPEEFCPETYQRRKNGKHDGYDALNAGALFNDEWNLGNVDEQNCDVGSHGQMLEEAVIADRTYRLMPPPDVGTLFAHKVWSGSKLLSMYIAENPHLVRGQCTVELGAGTGLPSLVSLSLGSTMSIITDYPDEDVLDALRETVGYNWNVCGDQRRVAVIGHEWGADVKNITNGAAKLFKARTIGYESSTCEQQAFYFDVVLLSECLWMHRTHGDLAKSIHSLLHPVHGMAIMTYAHHFPGKEEDDDAFFALCFERYGLKVQHVRTESMEYMWDSNKSIDVYLKIVTRPQLA